MRFLCALSLALLAITTRAEFLQCGQVIIGNLFGDSIATYEIQTNTDTYVTLSTCDSYTSLDTVVAVALGGEFVSANDDDNTCSQILASTTSFNAIANNVYDINIRGINVAGGTFRFSVTCQAPPAPISCGSSVQGSVTLDSSVVAYSYFADITGVITFSTCSSVTEFDTVLDVQQNDFSIAMNDDTHSDCTLGVASTVSINAVAGTTFTVLVSSYDISTSAGGFQLDVSCQAMSQMACGQPMYGSVSPQQSQSFLFAPDFESDVTISTCNEVTNFDTVLTIFQSDIIIGVNDDDIDCLYGRMSSFSFRAIPGNVYVISVSGFSVETGDFRLDMSCSRSSLECGSSVLKELSSVSTLFDVTAFTGTMQFSTCSFLTNFDTVLRVYANGALLAENDDSGPDCGSGSFVTVDTIDGVYYQVEVAGFEGAIGQFELSAHCIAVDPMPPIFVPQLTCDGSVQGFVESGQSVSFFYYSEEPKDVVFSTCSPLTDFDTVISVMMYDTVIAENDDNSGCGDNAQSSLVSFHAEPYVSYQIIVSGFDVRSGSFEMNLRCDENAIGNDESVLVYCDSLLSAPVPEGGRLTLNMYLSEDEDVTISTCNPDTDFDTILSVTQNQNSMFSNDDADCEVPLASSVSLKGKAGDMLVAEIIGFGSASGRVQVRVSCVADRKHSGCGGRSRLAHVAAAGLAFFSVCTLVTGVCVLIARRRCRRASQVPSPTSSPATAVTSAVTIFPREAGLMDDTTPSKDTAFVVVVAQ